MTMAEDKEADQAEEMPGWGRCRYSATGFCPAAGRGALACSRTKCPKKGNEETDELR